MFHVLIQSVSPEHIIHHISSYYIQLYRYDMRRHLQTKYQIVILMSLPALFSCSEAKLISGGSFGEVYLARPGEILETMGAAYVKKKLEK